ncbi:hypothetical protein RSAG8_01642, partial [Rhizoctonia solani AG-8 WAC10335]
MDIYFAVTSLVPSSHFPIRRINKCKSPQQNAPSHSFSLFFIYFFISFSLSLSVSIPELYGKLVTCEHFYPTDATSTHLAMDLSCNYTSHQRSRTSSHVGPAFTTTHRSLTSLWMARAGTGHDCDRPSAVQ